MQVPDQYALILTESCHKEGVDPNLLSAIITVESSWNTYAARYESNYSYANNQEHFAKLNGISILTEDKLQCFSLGLGQVMGGVARELGFAGPLPSLCDPKLGISLAAHYFKVRCLKYAKLEDQIVSYNAGSPVMRNGLYVDQVYIDKVMRVLNEGKHV